MPTADVSPDDQLRGALRDMWASVAPAWGDQVAYLDRRAAPVTAAMLDRARPRPGDRVLELACGPGGVGLAAAPLVTPGGSVVLSDLTTEMTDIAASRAAAAGFDHVTARPLDAEQIDEPDGTFDVVVCREGLMLVPDPQRAATEIRRVLRTGGRVAVAVWGPRDANPWLGALFDAITEHTGFPVPPPGVPGPFSLTDADVLASLLAGAGLTEVSVDEVANPMAVGSFEEWWSTVPALAGPVAQLLAGMPDDAVQAIRDHAATALDRYRTGASYDVPGLTLVASALAP